MSDDNQGGCIARAGRHGGRVHIELPRVMTLAEVRFAKAAWTLSLSHVRVRLSERECEDALGFTFKDKRMDDALELLGAQPARPS